MNLLENLGIKTIILQKDYVKLELPITAKLLQPYGPWWDQRSPCRNSSFSWCK